MTTQDKCCTIVPYFKVMPNEMENFERLCERFVQTTADEAGCLYYGWTFDGDMVHCREGYKDAEGALAHLANVGSLLQEALKIADLEKLEIHGPEEELAMLRGPLADYKPQFFTLKCGFRR